MIAAARTILRKDLLIELRTKESVPAMVLFSITVYVLFHFGLDRDSLDGELAAGVDDDHVGLRCVDEGAGLRGEDANMVRQEPERRNDLGGGRQGVRQQQQVGHCPTG